MKKPVSCPVETTLRVIGGHWKVLIIQHMLDGTKRFGELTRALKGVSGRTLTKQLRELESDVIINRKVYHQIPPMVEYTLTSSGEKLEPSFRTNLTKPPADFPARPAILPPWQSHTSYPS